MREDLEEEAADVFDDRRRLTIAHLCLGGVASFIYWIRPATIGLAVPGASYRFAAIVVLTFVAWIPYFVSWRVSLAVLAGKSRGVSTFIVIAALITAAAGVFYLNLFEGPEPVPALFVSAGVALLLPTAAVLCAAIPGDSADS